MHFDTTSRSLWGDYQCAEEQAVPFRVTYGYSKDKRPDLKQFMLSLLCVDRTVPILARFGGWQCLGQDSQHDVVIGDRHHPGPPRRGPRSVYLHGGCGPGHRGQSGGAGEYALYEPIPATYTECERGIEEAVSPRWLGGHRILATARAAEHRPATYYKASEGEVALYGKNIGPLFVHSTAQDKRRLQRLAREVHASA